jgi:hypothetical protein
MVEVIEAKIFFKRGKKVSGLYVGDLKNFFCKATVWTSKVPGTGTW